MRGKWRAIERRPATQDLSSRLCRIEHELSLLRAPEIQGSENAPRDHNQSNPPLQVPTFSGETSLSHNLTVVEGRLEQMGMGYTGGGSTSPNHHTGSRLTPSPNLRDHPMERRAGSVIHNSLEAHGITPDRELWDRLICNFRDEVHILVPFLHLPSLQEAYADVWERLSHCRHNIQPDGLHCVRVAHILLCLANGRCVESSRSDREDRQYSAGWRFYSAAREIFGDLLDGFHQCSNQILSMQTVVLMVIYLFRLDAHESAEKLLALTISHIHHLGLQRRRAVDSMALFESEMSRRLWWCVYLLDRRLAIETGRPFLIQDVNVDVGLPRNMSDEELSRYHKHLPGSDAGEDATAFGSTTVPYLVAMVNYSRVIGKVWEALYGAATSDSTPSPLIHEYLELLITQSQKEMQPEFTYDPWHARTRKTEGLAWWQIKQQLIMRIRWSSLYLLIRKPMLQRVWCNHQPAPEVIENQVICMRLVQNILRDYKDVSEEHPKYTFPFLHYLANALIIALGLIIKQPSFKDTYRDSTLEAARSLKRHCRRTWVSGNMARAIWKLNEMASLVLEPNNAPRENTDDGTSGFSAPRSVYTSCSRSGNSDSHQPGDTEEEQQLSVATPRPVAHLNGEETSDKSQFNPRSFGTRKSSHQSDRHEGLVTTDFDAEARALVSDTPGGCHTRNIFHHKMSSCDNSGGPSHVRQFGGDPAGTDGAYGIPLREAQIDPSHTPTVRDRGDLAPDPNAWVPGEMIGEGMEWLQNLFAKGLGTDLPPVWD
ncbi:hypothetical protein NUU61_007521 [Penicillium alfredii]|uniref:Xylanolytic transcriptional activator regulatory domain-containing protein n=1 Tax=Penicillium alfredii TaxID=1506179 RepID=A0A9W9F376_9EURO|nr:uncharacterized protein NUU61_007521 [Penicillium alfredii]KAJ5092651.1 hypothetical protein NUU61_007521 [Penicillium alfredii]